MVGKKYWKKSCLEVSRCVQEATGIVWFLPSLSISAFLQKKYFVLGFVGEGHLTFYFDKIGNVLPFCLIGLTVVSSTVSSDKNE